MTGFGRSGSPEERDAAYEAQRDALLYRGVLEVIAESYPDIPFEDGETTPYGKPTNRAIARAALGASRGVTRLAVEADRG